MKTCTVVKIAFPSLSQVFLFKGFQDINILYFKNVSPDGKNLEIVVLKNWILTIKLDMLR